MGVIYTLIVCCLFTSMATANTGLSRMVVGENHVATYEQLVGWLGSAVLPLLLLALEAG